MSLHVEIGELLAETRDAARLTQKQVAERLKVNQSQVSRLESGEADGSISDYADYLTAIGTSDAKRIQALIQAKWKHLPQPPLRHPNVQILVEIEEGLERLDSFKSGSSVPHALAGQAELLFRRLHEFGEFLLNLDHRVVYVGEIGVGKTTAACRQARLVINPANPTDLKGMMLDTGGGRTTLCEVYVQAGDRFSLEVAPLPDEEVYRLVEEFCRSIVSKRDGTPPSSNSADFKLPEEVERALRIMAQLPRPPRRRTGPQEPDPAAELASGRELSDFKAEVASRLTLWRRTRHAIDFDGADELTGRQWLRDTFTAINNGRHPDFSLPGQITVTVPFPLEEESEFDVTIVDTRGVDGSAIRPDILAQLKNRRALAVLCCKWGSAPDPSLQDLLKHLVDTEVDPTLLSRIAILVIARSGDALAMRHDSGEAAQDVLDGYEIKRGHVEDALQRINLSGISVESFDSASDDSAEVSKFLFGKIEDLRAAQVAAAKATIAAVNDMLGNVEKAQALAILDAINRELQIFAQRHASLKSRSRPVQTMLLHATRVLHPRTVWAATRRNGEFWNFDVYQQLGDGAAAEEKRRSASVIDGLREIIKNRLADESYMAAHTFLRELLDDISAWAADYVKAARHHALAVYKPKLSVAYQLWATTERKYGQGLDYREEVAADFESWFEEHEELQEELDELVHRAWNISVVLPLRKAAGNTHTCPEI
jgi:transcriptional regulator with XRE-family HTH domain